MSSWNCQPGRGGQEQVFLSRSNANCKTQSDASDFQTGQQMHTREKRQVQMRWGRVGSVGALQYKLQVHACWLFCKFCALQLFPMAVVSAARWRFDLAKKGDSVKVKDPIGMEKVEGDTAVVRVPA